MNKNINLSFSQKEFIEGVTVFSNEETRVKAFSFSGSSEFISCPDGVFLFKDIVVTFGAIICKILNGHEDIFRIYLLAEKRWLINKEKNGRELNFSKLIKSHQEFLHISCGKTDRVYVFSLEDWIILPKSEVCDFEKVEVGFFNKQLALLLKGKVQINPFSVFLVERKKPFSITWKGQEFFQFQKVLEKYLVMAFAEKDPEKIDIENVFVFSEKKMFTLPKKYVSTNFLGSLYGEDYIAVRTNRYLEEKPIFKILSTSTWKLESLKLDFSETISEIISPTNENGKIVFNFSPAPKKVVF
jgi:hypothetical protein